MDVTKPTETQVREALSTYAPSLADAPIAFLAEGWEFWAFTAGDHVLRFPRPVCDLCRLPEGTTNLDSLALERHLLPDLKTHLTTPVPDIDVYGEHGPNGLPFAGHRLLPGETVLYASRAPGPSFGREYGQLLPELTSFPVERAVELGVPYIDGMSMREQRGRHYERVIRRIFPIVTCETRTHIERCFEAYLNDAANFAFEPRLVHQDLDMNVLIDPQTGALAGVIDFGGAVVGNPALDWWLPAYGFKRLGIEDQLASCLEAAGMDEAELSRRMGEVDFIDFNFPLTDVLSGLERGDDAQVEEGLLNLNKAVPRDIVCA